VYVKERKVMSEKSETRSDRAAFSPRRRELLKAGLAFAVVPVVAGLSAGLMPAVAASAASGGTKEEIMPHVIVKLWPGRSEESKLRLAKAITEDLVRFAGASESSVTVAIEEIPSSEWKENVYDPEIRDNVDQLYKKPGYSM
jgi:4-oxalocrotonate tautomerase